MVNDNRPGASGGGGPAGSRANLAALIAVVIVAGALFWVVSAIRDHNAVQDCLDAGRHDCLPLDGR